MNVNKPNNNDNTPPTATTTAAATAIVQMSPEELAAFEAFKAEKKIQAQEQARRDLRQAYASLVDTEVCRNIERLEALSREMRKVKQEVYDNFKTVLELKNELFEGAAMQHSHTFLNADSTARIRIGRHTIDDYRDTVEDGIAMVRTYIESLAKDDTSKTLVNAVLRLMAKDQKGTLKASRVLQLRKMAEETGDEQFIEGVRIIEESYQPQETRTYISAQRKTDNGEWIYIPLNITTADL